MTETIDKLYLELSNVTQARNGREINLAVMVARMAKLLVGIGGHDAMVHEAREFLVKHKLDANSLSLRGDQ